MMRGHLSGDRLLEERAFLAKLGDRQKARGGGGGGWGCREKQGELGKGTRGIWS